MSSFTRPIAIQCAELASQRAATFERARLRRRLGSLATISSTAAFLGFLATLFGIANSFRSVNGFWGTAFASETAGLAYAMAPSLIGIYVALGAFWSYRALCGQLESFDIEMQTASVDLVNRLVVHLQRLRTADPILWSRLSQAPSAGHSVPVTPIRLPDFLLIHKSRHGLWQLLWPKIESETDASAILDTTGWIGIVYAAIGCLVAWERGHWITGVLTLAFFEAARRAMRKGIALGGFCGDCVSGAVVGCECGAVWLVGWVCLHSGGVVAVYGQCAGEFSSAVGMWLGSPSCAGFAVDLGQSGVGAAGGSWVRSFLTKTRPSTLVKE